MTGSRSWACGQTPCDPGNKARLPSSREAKSFSGKINAKVLANLADRCPGRAYIRACTGQGDAPCIAFMAKDQMALAAQHKPAPVNKLFQDFPGSALAALDAALGLAAFFS